MYKDEFLKLVQEKPELYKISKSILSMEILFLLKKKAYSFDSIYGVFSPHNISKDRIEEELNRFLSLGLIKTTKIAGKVFYYLSDFGKEFLDIYEKAKSEFSLE